MVSTDEVRMAYRMFLDREPENEEVVAKLASVSSLQELRARFIRSTEFKMKMMESGWRQNGAAAKREATAELQYPPPRTGLRLDECQFYHTMDIPGVGLVKGFGWDHRAHVDDIFYGIDFSGKRVMEVGPASGFLTSAMDQRGAEVVSIEAPKFHKWDLVPFPDVTVKWQGMGEDVWEKNTNAWWFVHEHCKLRAKVYYVGAYDIDTVPLGRFDATVLSHVLLHARDPLKIIQNCAAITDHDIIICELVRDLESFKLPIIRLTPDPSPLPGEENYNAWWQFSTSFFTNFLAICGFTKTRVHRYSLSYKGVLHENFTLVASRP